MSTLDWWHIADSVRNDPDSLNRRDASPTRPLRLCFGETDHCVADPAANHLTDERRAPLTDGGTRLEGPSVGCVDRDRTAATHDEPRQQTGVRRVGVNHIRPQLSERFTNGGQRRTLPESRPRSPELWNDGNRNPGTTKAVGRRPVGTGDHAHHQTGRVLLSGQLDDMRLSSADVTARDHMSHPHSVTSPQRPARPTPRPRSCSEVRLLGPEKHAVHDDRRSPRACG